MISSFNRTWVSYLLDWVIIVLFIGIAAAFTILEPVKRDFSLTDKAISFPYRPDTISILTVFLVAVVAPAAIITIICALFIKLPTRTGPEPSRSAIWKRKLWEWHAALLGLGLSLALSFFLTQTMKNMFGKHRPDFLARCNPDITAMSKYVVGGFTSEVLEGTSQLVSWGICLSKDGGGVGKSEFLDGFRSFPSGHCTIAFAGLTYLALFLAAKLSATVPFLPSEASNSLTPDRAWNQRKAAAAPPLYLLVVVLVPIGAAVYIASTRFTDGKHAGFDILFASVEGIICAWFSFRWYHLPVSRGAGWAWGPRHRNVAFGSRTGVWSYGTNFYKGKQSRDFGAERGGVHGVGVELQDLEHDGSGGTGSYASQRELVR